MKNTRDLFRENLRQIIVESGLKLEKAAEKCEISLSALNQILSGKSAYSPETIDKICEGLKITPGDLFRDRSISEKAAAPESEIQDSGLILKKLDELKEVIVPTQADPRTAVALEIYSKLKSFGDDLLEEIKNLDFRTANRIRLALELSALYEKEQGAQVQAEPQKTKPSSSGSSR